MNGAGPRVAFVTRSYPPQPGPRAAMTHRLVERLADAGVCLVVCTLAQTGDPAMTAARDSRVPVYRVSCDVEGLVMLDLEDRRRRFDLLHAYGLPAALRLHRPPWSLRPTVVTLDERDSETLDTTAIPVLAGAVWITAPSEAALARAVRMHDIRAYSSVIRDDDGDQADQANRIVQVYARGLP